MELFGAVLLVGVVVVSMARHLDEIMADVHRRASAAHVSDAPRDEGRP